MSRRRREREWILETLLEIVVGTIFRVVILVQVGVNDLVMVVGAMICFFSDEQDGGKEEGPIFFLMRHYNLSIPLVASIF